MSSLAWSELSWSSGGVWSPAMTRRMALARGAPGGIGIHLIQHGRHSVGSWSVSAGGVDDRVDEIFERLRAIVCGVDWAGGEGVPGVGAEGDVTGEDLQSAAGDDGLGGAEAMGEALGIAFVGVDAAQNRDDVLAAGFVAKDGELLVEGGGGGLAGVGVVLVQTGV